MENRDFGKLLREFQEIAKEAYDPEEMANLTSQSAEAHAKAMKMPNKPASTQSTPKQGVDIKSALSKLRSMFGKKKSSAQTTTAAPQAPSYSNTQQDSRHERINKFSDETMPAIIKQMKAVASLVKGQNLEVVSAKLNAFIKNIEEQEKQASSYGAVDEAKKTSKTVAAAAAGPSTNFVDQSQVDKAMATVKSAQELQAASEGTAIEQAAQKTVQASNETAAGAKAEKAVTDAIQQDKLTMNDIIAAGTDVFGRKRKIESIKKKALEQFGTDNPKLSELIKGAQWTGFDVQNNPAARRAIGLALGVGVQAPSKPAQPVTTQTVAPVIATTQPPEPEPQVEPQPELAAQTAAAPAPQQAIHAPPLPPEPEQTQTAELPEPEREEMMERGSVQKLRTANDKLIEMLQGLGEYAKMPVVRMAYQFATAVNGLLQRVKWSEGSEERGLNQINAASKVRPARVGLSPNVSRFEETLKRAAKKLFTENRRNKSMSTLKIHKNDMKKLIAESLEEMFLEEELAENYLEEMCDGKNLAEKPRELEESPMFFDRSKTKGGMFNKGTSANRMANRDLPPEAKHEPGEDIPATIPDLPAGAPKDWPKPSLKDRLNARAGTKVFEEAVESVINEELYKDDIGLVIESILKNK